MRVKFCGITNLDDAAEAVRLGAWAIGLIHYDEQPALRRAGGGGEIGAAFRRKCEVVGVFVNPTLEEVDRGGRERGADDGAAERRRRAPQFCAEVARRTGVKVIKAIHVASAADIHAAEAYRTDFHLFDRRGKGLWGGHRRELRLGAAARAPLDRCRTSSPAGCGPTTSPRRSPSPSPTRSTSPAASRPSPGARTTRRWPPSSRPPQPAGVRHAHERGRGALRPLRGPLRAGDADRGARRADRGLGRGPRGRRVHGPRCDLLRRDFIGRPTPLYLAERLSERVGSPGLPEARGPRPHRRPQDQQRGRPGAAGAADGQAAGDRRDRRRPARRRHRHRLRPARARMRRLHGHRGHPPPGAQRRADEAAGGRGGPGRGRRPHPQGGGQRRDPRLGRQRRHDPLRDRLRGRPGALSGAGPRPAAGDRRRGARAGAGGRGRRCRRG